MKMKYDPRFKYAAVTFISGFVLMAVEIIASRVVAPLIGSSIYSWTAIIGVVLFGISLGNYYGGKLIDKNPNPEILAYSLLTAAISIALIPLLVNIADPLVLLGIPLLLKVSILAALFFLLPSVLLGTIFPSAIKLYMRELSVAGESAGLLSGLGALGSITGTFLTGFFFIGFIGSSFTLYTLSLILVITSWTFYKSIKYIAAALIVISMLFITNAYGKNKSDKVIFESESNYYDIKVVRGKYNNSDVRLLFLDLDGHSIEGTSGKKVGTYQEISPILRAFTKNIRGALVIGGGSYQIPKDIARLYGANVTVVEIDPTVTDIANKFFNAADYPIHTVNTDGRLFLKTGKEKFDVIFADAFNSFISMPWYMATEESFTLSSESLNNKGVYALSIISTLSGPGSGLYQSVLKTFSQVFSNYYVLYLGKNENDIQNIILVGKNSEEKVDELELKNIIASLAAESGGKLNVGYLYKPKPDPSAIIMKDDFAPVEKLTTPLINSYIEPYALWASSFLK